MPYTGISASLSEADVKEIKAALNTITGKLPFLIHLSVEERRRQLKLGDKGLMFVSDSLSAAESKPGILPADFDMAEFVRDYHLMLALRDIQKDLVALNEKLDDTLLAVSSEAMSSGLTVYEYVKTAAKRLPGLKNIADALGARFRAIRNRTPKAPVA